MGTVFVSILLMFIVLFRRISLSIVAILPNLLGGLRSAGTHGVVGHSPGHHDHHDCGDHGGYSPWITPFTIFTGFRWNS